MEKEKNVSEHIRNFILFVDSIVKEYDYYSRMQSDCEKANTDLLHQIELGDYKDRNKATTALRKSLLQRREAKNNLAILKPIADWIADYSSSLKSLRNTLGEVRKKENVTQKYYYPRIIRDLPIYKNQQP